MLITSNLLFSSLFIYLDLFLFIYVVFLSVAEHIILNHKDVFISSINLIIKL